MIFFIALASALASDTNSNSKKFYNIDDIARHSSVFRETSKLSQKGVENAESELRKYSTALQELDMASSALGIDAEKEWSQRAKKEVLNIQYKYQQHLDHLQDGYSSSFLKAFERSLKKLAPDAVECKSSGMPMRRKKCKGESVNEILAKAIDNDKKLKADLKKINKLEWPNFALKTEKRPRYPISNDDGERYIQLSLMLEEHLSASIERQNDQFKRAHRKLEENIKKGDKESLEKAKLLRKENDKQIHQITQKLTEASKIIINGKKGCFFGLIGAEKPDKRFAGLTYCVNPDLLGGCDGKDLSQDFTQSLENSKGAQKIFEKLNSKTD